jgi:hypothetical protein
MSTHNEVPGPAAADQAPSPGISAGTPQLASARRRRFIKLGAGSVPVALTLASRPAMAWHCNSTSAWGSAQMNESSKARLDDQGHYALNECWYISNWCNNTTRSAVKSGEAPWAVVGKMCWEPDKNSAQAKAALLISTIFPSGLNGVAPSSNVFNTLTSSSTASYKKSLIVARLNALYSGVNIAICTMSGGEDMLQKMAKDGANVFAPNSSAGTWSDSAIVTYLHENWMARSS